MFKADFDFRHVQIERAIGKTSAAQGGGETPAFLDHGFQQRDVTLNLMRVCRGGQEVDVLEQQKDKRRVRVIT